MSEPLGKFLSVIRLNALDRARERSDQVFQKLSRGIRTVFFKGFHEAPSGILVNRGVLIKFLPFCFVDKAYGRYEFYIDLDALTGISHLFIRFCGVLGISGFDRHDALFTQKTV